MLPTIVSEDDERLSGLGCGGRGGTARLEIHSKPKEGQRTGKDCERGPAMEEDGDRKKEGAWQQKCDPREV
jgi:hypothetical protein